MTHRSLSSSSLSMLICALFCPCVQALGHEPGEVKDTQEITTPFLTPQQALDAWELPEGFRANLYAHEPMVRQPIAMTFDERGRMWVAENDTYAESKVGYDLSQHDRVLILEDTDGDGTADTRKVFWDQGQRLTSVAVGFGGVWVLCAPHLLFIPDANRDDIPDAPPQVVLDGWDGDSIRHNIVNGLKWGPDGWLYGRHGITTTSYVGVPGTPQEERTAINCGIWRFHPQRKTFEVVCHGGTNSWGHDWNEEGELFFINTVIGHLWHALPGAHYERMFGDDFNPHLYKLMPQTADHFHWDTNERWSDIRKTGVTNTTDAAGGGHAHCGMLIYQGDNWPEQYRGKVLTCNLHGLRINCDRLERPSADKDHVRNGTKQTAGSAGYIGKHEPDFAKTKDPWFRGIDLATGPDGAVYVLDWSDIGECHDNDGIHRSSGRIFRISYGETKSREPIDLSNLEGNELLQMQVNSNRWYADQARRLLQERAVAGEDQSQVIADLKAYALNGKPEWKHFPHLSLRCLSCLQSMDALEDSELYQLLDDPEDIIRAAAVRILANQEIKFETGRKVSQTLAEIGSRTFDEPSGLVQLRIASALQRMPLEARIHIGRKLAASKFRNGNYLPLMIWYGIEPAVLEYPHEAITLALSGREVPILTEFISRRIAIESKTVPETFELLIQRALKTDEERVLNLLKGITAAFNGLPKATPPKSWNAFATKFGKSSNEEIQRLVRELSVIFGDGRALDEIRHIAQDGNESLSSRRNAIAALVAARDNDSIKMLQGFLGQRDLAATAVRGLAAFDDPDTPELIIMNYGRMYRRERPAAIETLAARPQSALALLMAVKNNRIPINDVSPFFIRQMRSFDNKEIQTQLQAIWPDWRHTSEEKQKKIEELKSLLTTERVTAADASAGRALFQKSCASCHTLFGAGGKLAPDLTGAQRHNLMYLLENIVDPSAQVAEKFRMSIIALIDGRVISGVVIRESDDTLTIQTPTDFVNLAKADIEQRRQTNLSMMPERLLDTLTEQQIADLTAYLMSPTQVALPE